MVGYYAGKSNWLLTCRTIVYYRDNGYFGNSSFCQLPILYKKCPPEGSADDVIV